MSLQLKSIYDYIANNLINEPASYHLKYTIENKFESISIFPNSGTSIVLIANDISKEFLDIRRRLAKNYAIFYRYYEDDENALITHVFHQMQDYDKIFQK